VQWPWKHLRGGLPIYETVQALSFDDSVQFDKRVHSEMRSGKDPTAGGELVGILRWSKTWRWRDWTGQNNNRRAAKKMHKRFDPDEERHESREEGGSLKVGPGNLERRPIRLFWTLHAEPENKPLNQGEKLEGGG